MLKRKLDVNQLKRSLMKGRKNRTINVKYEHVFAYFKQKQVKEKQIFEVDFLPLVEDLLSQLNSLQLIYNVENQAKQVVKPLQFKGKSLKLQSLNIKKSMSNYPIDDIINCLYVQRQSKTILGINKSKQNLFFKNLRNLFPDYCACAGQKCIVQNVDIRNFYQIFKTQWSKAQDKGKNSNFQKMQSKICRSLYFFGILIENNIFTSIDDKQRKIKEDQMEVGTKSQKKLNFYSTNQPVSSTYSFGSADIISNFSIALKSRRSEIDSFWQSQYSQKSQKVYRNKPSYNLFNKVQIKNLKIKVPPLKNSHQILEPPDQKGIDLLSNEVQNLLIQKAFRLKMFQDSYTERGMYLYDQINMNQYSQMNRCFELIPTSRYQNMASQVQLHQLRRSSQLRNFVETRKANRPTSKKYN